MMFSGLLIALPALAICSAAAVSSHLRRDVTETAPIVAYGTNISALAVVIGALDGECPLSAVWKQNTDQSEASHTYPTEPFLTPISLP